MPAGGGTLPPPPPRPLPPRPPRPEPPNAPGAGGCASARIVAVVMARPVPKIFNLLMVRGAPDGFCRTMLSQQNLGEYEIHAPSHTDYSYELVWRRCIPSRGD